jgi:hypothetical protein
MINKEFKRRKQSRKGKEGEDKQERERSRVRVNASKTIIHAHACTCMSASGEALYVISSAGRASEKCRRCMYLRVGNLSPPLSEQATTRNKQSEAKIKRSQKSEKKK